MNITNHKLDGAAFIPTKKTSGRMREPKFLVMHYTAGWSADSAISVLGDGPGNRKASAHIVMARDGSITQMVPFDTKAWHAGPSKHGDYEGLNSNSIGIEIVNIGFVRPHADGSFTLHSGTNRVLEDVMDKSEWIEQEYPKVGSGPWLWQNYTPEQLDSLDTLVAALLEEYPSIEWIVSHEEIDTRGWKTDPGPAFPMERYQEQLNRASGSEEDDRVGDVYTVSAPKTGQLKAHPADVVVHLKYVSLLNHGQQVVFVEQSTMRPKMWRVKWWDNGQLLFGWVNSDFLKSASKPIESLPSADSIPTDLPELSWEETMKEVRLLLKDDKFVRVTFEKDGVFMTALVETGDLIDKEIISSPTEKPVKHEYESPPLDVRVTTVDGLNIRDSAPYESKDGVRLGEIVGQFAEGNQVNVVRDNGDGWLYINYWINGVRKDGWINERYVK